MTRTIVLAGLFALALASSAEQRPVEEMGGTCRDYRWNLAQEFSAWRQDAIRHNAATNADEALSVALLLKQKYLLGLHPAADVHLVIEAEDTPELRTDYAGLASIKVLGSGFYRISMSAPLDIEVAEHGQRIAPREYEMQQRCESVYKTIEYTLRAGVEYVIQVTGATAAEAPLLVTARR